MITSLINKYEKHLYKHLEDINALCLLNGIIIKWLCSLMILNIDERLTNLFFNCLFFAPSSNSIFILYCFIIRIFKILKPELIKAKSQNEADEVLNKVVKFNDDNFNKMIFYIFIDQNRYIFFDEKVKKQRQNEIEKIIKNKKVKFNFKDENNALCNKNYPFCVKERCLNKEIERFVVYTTSNDLDNYFIEDYIYSDKNDMIQISENPNNNSNIKDILVERRKHICEE